MKPLQTTVAEVLRDAIASEVESRAMLLRLAERAASPATKKKLSELADRELLHRARMERRYRELIGTDPPEPAEPDVRISEDVTNIDIRRALKIVLERERDAESNYRFLAERVPHTELGALFLELAETEWKHKAEIQREYDSASGDSPDSFLDDL